LGEDPSSEVALNIRAEEPSLQSSALVMLKEHSDCLVDDLLCGYRQAFATDHPGPQRELIERAHELMSADSDEAARLKRDDCAQGFLDDAAPL